MWCNRCQQDVPGIASGDRESGVACARCSKSLATDGKEDSADPLAKLKNDTPWALDDWEVDDELRSVQRMIDKLRVQGIVSPARLDQPHSETSSSSHLFNTAPFNSAPVTTHNTRRNDKSEKVPPKTSFMGSQFAWMITLLSFAGLAGGAALLVWSTMGQRSELWNLGIGIAATGQAGLIVGLVLHLWSNSRSTHSTLNEIDDQLDDLRHAAAMIGNRNSTPAQNFYAHMAQGGDPELLLADLKGQMDLLAVRLANTRR